MVGGVGTRRWSSGPRDASCRASATGTRGRAVQWWDKGEVPCRDPGHHVGTRESGARLAGTWGVPTRGGVAPPGQDAGRVSARKRASCRNLGTRPARARRTGTRRAQKRVSCRNLGTRPETEGEACRTGTRGAQVPCRARTRAGTRGIGTRWRAGTCGRAVGGPGIPCCARGRPRDEDEGGVWGSNKKLITFFLSDIALFIKEKS